MSKKSITDGEPYRLADVKFNNGNGALLCNGCSIILAIGHTHEDKLHYCDECRKKIVDIPN